MRKPESRATVSSLRRAALAVLVVALAVVPGCAFKRGPANAETAPEAAAAAGRAMDGGSAAADQGPTADRLIEENVRLQHRVIESEFRVRNLEQQLTAMQSRLDEAIQDVVRTKAKLRSVESRAEAASAMAETEIALKAATEQAGPRGAPELSQARDHLRMGTEEFRRQNYGGALYLTGQAKYQIRNLTARLDSEEKIARADGEQAFTAPLFLRVTTRSNMREGPGTEFDVLATLEAETKITGYSYKGEWIRVEGTEGAVGWIHQKLVSRR